MLILSVITVCTCVVDVAVHEMWFLPLKMKSAKSLISLLFNFLFRISKFPLSARDENEYIVAILPHCCSLQAVTRDQQHKNTEHCKIY